ncbi:hypothetical protein QAD02_018673 [Eretmocerus hayati]|uniref:Uncharacterized protein n=1 Tax=Eretmocerus hayati TaxID=131215 RepID=A0ACC2PHF2_9HYME|nr:hypothetical protein QAD02_018673 [Eretmocerus hayati]
MAPVFQHQNISEAEKDSCGKLQEAIQTKNKDLVKYLVDSGFNVNGIEVYSHRSKIGVGYFNGLPLHLAVTSKCLAIVELLLSRGANISAKCKMCDTPLTLAARMRNTELVDLILSFDVQNAENECSGLSHFHTACMRNNLKVAKRLILIDQGKSINKAVKKDSFCWAGYTALHFAVHYGCIETVEFLLQCRADIAAEDKRNLTPLHVAHLHRNEEIIDFILSAHKQLYEHPANSDGLSHFHIACTRNNVSFVKHFFDIGVDVNEPSCGWTPMDYASYYGCSNVVNLLLETEVFLFGTCISQLSNCVLVLRDDPLYNLCIKERRRFQRRYKYLIQMWNQMSIGF